MKIDLFDYDLPEDLIAFHPPEKRDGGRLLVLDPSSGKIDHRRVVDLPAYLPAGALLVANDTRVIRARLRGQRPTGGAVEVLLVREVEAGDKHCCWTALTRANKPIRIEDQIVLDEVCAVVTERGSRGEATLRFDVSSKALRAYAQEQGEVPLPPYIRRAPIPEDVERYQTVFARSDGSVAAPTAGLHFTPALLGILAKQDIETEYLTLHVGPGTFRPVTAADTNDHQMDAEQYTLTEETAGAIDNAKREGRPVFAVGTTVTRALEGVFAERGRLEAGAGSTDLFITPGFEFQVVDGLLTNFHLPKSTLLCLVSALAGRENVLAAYKEAVNERYRFYSFGDAMLIMSRTI